MKLIRDRVYFGIGSERRRFLWKFKDDDNDQEWRAMVNDYSSIIFSSYTRLAKSNLMQNNRFSYLKLWAITALIHNFHG